MCYLCFSQLKVRSLRLVNSVVNYKVPYQYAVQMSMSSVFLDI